MKLSPRDELIVEIVAIVLIAVALSMLLVRPQLSKLGELEAQRREEEQSIRNAQAELALLEAAKGEALQIQADLIKVGNRVPDSPQLPSLVVQIQDLANEAGISFVEIKPGELEPAGQYTIMPLDLSLSGQFFDVVDFLYRLEHLSREVRVKSIDLSRGGQSSGAAAGGQSGDGGSATPATEGNSLTLKIQAQVFVMGKAGPAVPAPGGAGSEGAAPAPATGEQAPSGQ
ncbi:MAG: hypothetical protein C4521_06150 [Actinobacteria bacterium]|nr:MAG: hypothetical protein C4521_06150 [Actinomycetota bacterium]